MKLKLLLAASISTAMFAPMVASANDGAGWYLRGNIGYGTHTDTDLEGDIQGAMQSEGNATGSVGFGYDFGPNWRLEADVAQLFTDNGQLNNERNSFAKLESTTAMLNALYDFDGLGSWEPYIGAGFGVMQVQLGAESHPGFATTNCTGGVACGIRETDTTLAYQVLAGLGYAITDNLTWDTHYRFADAIGDHDFQGTRVASIVNNVPTTSIAFSNLDVSAHSVMTGFRYKFGAPVVAPIVVEPQPEPAPVPTVTCWDGSMVFNASACPAEPAPVPTVTCWDGSIVTDAAFCPTQTRSMETVESLCSEQYRQEIVYYAFNKGQSAETRQKVNRILDIGEFCNVSSIQVVGHTDSSGSAAYNQGLSERRAADVRKELVREGIRPEVITSMGKGETELFVQTGDGVKEQLNRRTEVLINLSSVGGIN